MDDNNAYKLAYERERKARLAAETLLEDKTREIFKINRELKSSYEVLKKQQEIMLSSEKLATLGTLSAGVAHEINNPLAFVKSNIESLPQYYETYARLVLLIKEMMPSLSKPHRDQLEAFFKDEDIDFIQEDIPDLMKDTMEGLTRVKDIILNLRSFARTQSTDRGLSNVKEGIESTLKILNSELKNSVDIKLTLNPVPDIFCNANEINQVFLNLIINAKQAMEGRDRPTIEITSDVVGDFIEIKIADNGCGIPAEVQKDIFVPFFTTKPVGEGTGMGLAIAYGIIQDHGGDISLQSSEGEGTVFSVKLPITQEE